MKSAQAALIYPIETYRHQWALWLPWYHIYLYHTKTILTNQIALFEGHNGFPPRHVPKIRTAFSMAQIYVLAGSMTRYIPQE